VFVFFLVIYVKEVGKFIFHEDVFGRIAQNQKKGNHLVGETFRISWSENIVIE
jgi:hypothetical protein